MANTFLRTKKVGSPCESFSVTSGIALQMRRTRWRWSSVISAPNRVTGDPHAGDRSCVANVLQRIFVQHDEVGPGAVGDGADAVYLDGAGRIDSGGLQY